VGVWRYLRETNKKVPYHEINFTFTEFIHIIQDACPALTGEEIVFCCLSKLGLPASVVASCMGNVDLHAVNQRRYRIKKKMTEAKREELFVSIFR
jgi:hypothetical protein